MITTAFDTTIYGYLREEGYTHVQLKGLQPVTQSGEQYYYIAPLKKDDPRIDELLWDGLAVALEEEATALLFEEIGYAKLRIEWEVAEYAGYLLAISG